jgi:hypothetical protein
MNTKDSRKRIFLRPDEKDYLKRISANNQSSMSKFIKILVLDKYLANANEVYGYIKQLNNFKI